MFVFSATTRSLIVASLSIVFLQGCATKVSFTEKRIKQNYRFSESFVVEKINVKGFDPTGFPSQYDVEATYIANDLWSLDDKGSADLLKGETKQRFLFLKNRKDSFDHANVLEERSGDTIHMRSGTIVYTPAGSKRPVEYFRIQEEMERMIVQIKRKTKKKILFSRPNKWYRWYLPGKEGNKNNTLKFERDKWYKTSMHCSYGLLTDGYCTFYFSFDANGRTRLKRKDRINDGPF